MKNVNCLVGDLGHRGNKGMALALPGLLRQNRLHLLSDNQQLCTTKYGFVLLWENLFQTTEKSLVPFLDTVPHLTPGKVQLSEQGLSLCSQGQLWSWSRAEEDSTRCLMSSGSGPFGTH